MKNLKLKALALSAADVLTRAELKNVVAGSGVLVINVAALMTLIFVVVVTQVGQEVVWVMVALGLVFARTN